jgi:hypothetical protein
MRRREFLGLVGAAAAFYPVGVLGQRMRSRLGILSINSPDSEAHFIGAFKEALQGLGYIDGRTIDIDYRAAAIQKAWLNWHES